MPLKSEEGKMILWSRERSGDFDHPGAVPAFRRKDEEGYTCVMGEAGYYTAEEAKKIVEKSNGDIVAVLWWSDEWCKFLSWSEAWSEWDATLQALDQAHARLRKYATEVWKAMKEK